MYDIRFTDSATKEKGYWIAVSNSLVRYLTGKGWIRVYSQILPMLDEAGVQYDVVKDDQGRPKWRNLMDE